MGKKISLFYVLFAVMSCVYGQNFLENKITKTVQVIDSLVIKNANIITFSKSELRTHIYNDSIRFYYIRTNKAFITNDSCLKEIQLKKLKSTDIYPNYGIYTFQNAYILYYIINRTRNYLNFHFDHKNEENYRPDTIYIEKFNEDETEFYLCLVKASFFYRIFGDGEKIPEEKPFLALIPKKWVMKNKCFHFDNPILTE